MEFSEDVLESATRIYIEADGETWDSTGELFTQELAQEWVSRSRFNKATTEAATIRTAVVRLKVGMSWLAGQHHETLHKDMIAKGQATYMDCDAKTCKYAREVAEYMAEYLPEI